MAVDFPDSPTLNQTFVSGSSIYQWNGTVWQKVNIRSYTVDTLDTAPTTAVDGQLWFDENDGTLNVYYDDGSSAQWVVASGPPGVSIAAGSSGDEVFWENDQTVTADYTISDGKNALSAGPITIADGITVTIGAGETWRIV